MLLQGLRSKDMAESNTIDEGTYKMRVNKLEYKDGKVDEKTGAKSPDYCMGDFVVQEEGPFFGRHVFQYMSLKQGDDWRMRQLSDAIHYPPDQDIDTDKFVDGEFYGVVGKSKGGKGKDGNYYPPQNQINRFVALDAPLEVVGR